LLEAAEAKWAPPEDPVFQLVPPDFESHVTQCFEDLEKPEVTFNNFWDVYCELRDLVGAVVPDDLTVLLSESILDDADGAPEPFALADLKEPDLGGVRIDTDENEDIQDEALYVDFTLEEGIDQLF